MTVQYENKSGRKTGGNMGWMYLAQGIAQ